MAMKLIEKENIRTPYFIEIDIISYCRASISKVEKLGVKSFKNAETQAALNSAPRHASKAGSAKVF